MKKRHVIADTDILSAFVKAEHRPELNSKPQHIPQIYGTPILVPAVVADVEMKDPRVKPEVRAFAEHLPHGFEMVPEQDFDPELGRHFDLELEKGDVQCIALAEALAATGDTVLILSNEKKIFEVVRQRVEKNRLGISVENTPAVLCKSAEAGIIPNLAQEAYGFHSTGVYQFSEKDHQKIAEFRKYLDQVQQQSPNPSLQSQSQISGSAAQTHSESHDYGHEH